MIICCDFDGTIVEHEYPDIGKPLPLAFEVLKELKALGVHLILWTCREDQRRRNYLTEAVEFCRANGVEFDAVNETIVEKDFRDGPLRRKPYAHYYIDDAVPGGFIGWEAIRRYLIVERIRSAN